MARKGGILCQASTAAMRFVVSAIFLIWACSVCALPQQDEYYGDVQEAQPPYGQQDQSGYDQQNQPGYDQQDQSGYGQQDQSGYYGPSQAEYDESGSPEYQDSDQTQYDESDQTQYQRTEPGTTNVEFSYRCQGRTSLPYCCWIDTNHIAQCQIYTGECPSQMIEVCCPGQPSSTEACAGYIDIIDFSQHRYGQYTIA